MQGKKTKSTLVIGLGLSGMSAAAFLARRGRSVIAVDSSDSPTLQTRAEALIKLGCETMLGIQQLPLDVEMAVTSPGIPHELLTPLREKKVPIIGELELGCREIACPIIAVTGTNGKSTVVTNIEKGMSQAGVKCPALGNLGTPVTEWVDQKAEADAVVIEVSSYQLETISQFRPKVAVILNIAPDHLGHHGGMDGYVKAKSGICMNQTLDDALLLHKDLAAYPTLQKTRGRLYWYGKDLPPSSEGLNLAGDRLQWNGEGVSWSRQIDVEGILPHDVDNLMACVAVMQLMGIPVEKSLSLFDTYERLPHRLELAGVIDNVKYIDDSKATNAHAAIAALKTLADPFIWLVGGEGKGEDLCDLVAAARDSHVAEIICFGRDREIFAEALKAGFTPHVTTTLREGFDLSRSLASEGMSVLLSPAGASFDEFKSFEDRGDKFQAWVRAAMEASQ